ncbi:MAG TPA: YraN family protein [Candidatus Krumholzibacteria bacterium]|nr:YraN family protein [Candidatus Krumholzibacteria bacterium]
MSTRQTGQWGEEIAALFLRLKGFEVLRTNARYERREVDLVVRDGNALVAVEVKLRIGDRFGTAAESIDERKLARLRVALTGIARELGLALSPRIDVVTIDIEATGESMRVEHYAGVS